MNATRNTPTESAAAILDALAAVLRDVHKLLLEAQSYQIGATIDPLQLLQLATTDKRFAWISPLTKLIAELDDRRTKGDTVTYSTVDRYAEAIQDLIPMTGGGPDLFYNAYTSLMQTSPDLAMAHAALRRVLLNIHKPRQQIEGKVSD